MEQEDKTEETEENTDKKYTVESDIQLQIAKWAGTGDVGQATKVYADLEEENDYQDKTSSLSLSNGAIPLISNKASTGGTTYSLGAKGLLAGESYIFETTSKKYGNIVLSFNMKSSKTAPKTFDVSYSTDGETYQAVKTLTQDAASTYQTFAVTLPSGADNAEKLYIKLTAGEKNFNGAAPQSGASNYIQSIQIKANPIVSDEVVSIVNVTPDAGAVAVGETLTMETKTEGASIFYSINGGEEKRYDEKNKPVLETLPAVVTTYAVKEGVEDSLKVTYAYTQAKVATVKASPDGGAITANTKIKLTCATKGATILYSFDEGANWNEYNDEDRVTVSDFSKKLQVKAVKEGYEESSVVSLSFTQRVNDEYGLYFGQLHSHTTLSDGAGKVEDAFAYASSKDRKNIDFLAVTDHSNSFDGINTASSLGQKTVQAGNVAMMLQTMQQQKIL